MSFDVSFRPGDGFIEPDLDVFKDYFASRAGYEFDDETLEFSYFNEVSGASFTFIFEGPMRTQISPEDERTVLCFTLSYSASFHRLVDEACLEIKQLTERFGLLYDDAQMFSDRAFRPFSEQFFRASLLESAGFGRQVLEHLKAEGHTILE